MNFALFVLHIFVFSKHAHLGLILNRDLLQVFLQNCNLKEKFLRRCFPVNFAKFLKTTFFT